MHKCPICTVLTGEENISLGGYRISQCPECSLRFAPDAFTANVNYSDVYTTPEYAESQLEFLKNINGEKVIEEIATYRPFFEVVRGMTGCSLLDIGCGVGRFCHAASGRGWDVVGIDISERAIDAGKRLAKFPLYNCSIDDVIASGKTFDVLTAFEVIEHLAEPVGFLTKAKQLLKPGGELFCTVPNWDSDKVKYATRNDYVPPIHLCFYTRASFENLLLRSGFRDVKTGVIWSGSKLSPLGRLKKNLIDQVRNRTGKGEGLWGYGKA